MSMSIYTDPTIGHHLTARRDRCPGSLCVRQGVADALANRPFTPTHNFNTHPYYFKFYRLGYEVALGYMPDNAAHRRGYEDWLSGLPELEDSPEYSEGYWKAAQDESDEISGQMGYEDIYYHDLDYRPY